MKVPAVLKNKYLFYALAVLAALNVVGYASVKAYECLALFLLAGYGMHCYCKNKSLAILAALFVANFVFGCGRVKEGFEEAMKAPEDLLKDAADAASKAGEALAMKEGAQGQGVRACTAIVDDLLNTRDACDEAHLDGDDTKRACNYTPKKEADTCYKDGQAVPFLADGTTATNEQNCTGDVGQWNATEAAATCM